MILTWGFFSLIDLDVYNMMQSITQFRQIIDLVRSCSEPTIYFSRQYRSIQQEARSGDANNGLDAFSGHSMSTNMS